MRGSKSLTSGISFSIFSDSIYGGFDTITSKHSFIFSNKSDSIKSTPALFSLLLISAISKAFFEISAPTTCALSHNLSIDMAIHPEPVHISRTFTLRS